MHPGVPLVREGGVAWDQTPACRSPWASTRVVGVGWGVPQPGCRGAPRSGEVPLFDAGW